MPPKKTSRVSVRDIAHVAGVSKSAVSYALKNSAEVSKATRNRVLKVARRLGYSPDASLSSWMQVMRKAKTQDLLPIAWLNSKPDPTAWRKLKYLSPYLEGAKARALELGYRIEEIWTHAPGMTMRRVSQIIQQRGIEGVIVSQPAIHVRLNWSHISGVSIDGSLLAPGLHRVMMDNAGNLGLALKALRRAGYRRIGICLDDDVDRFSNRTCRAAATYHHVTTQKPHRIPPLFYPWRIDEPREIWDDQIISWIRRFEPEVIVGLDNRLRRWVEKAGFRVPQDIGIVHLALDDDASAWAGVYANKRLIGRAAVEWVVSLIQNRQFGLPEVAFNTLVGGSWRPGDTLIPKRKLETLSARPSALARQQMR